MKYLYKQKSSWTTNFFILYYFYSVICVSNLRILTYLTPQIKRSSLFGQLQSRQPRQSGRFFSIATELKVFNNETGGDVWIGSNQSTL